MQRGSTYQGLGGTVEGVTVVAAELGVNTLEGRVTVGLGLLDTVRTKPSQHRLLGYCRCIFASHISVEGTHCRESH